MHTDTTDLLNRGVAYHQAGRLEDARVLYEQLLLEEPDNSDGQHLLGLIAHQRGQHEEAVRLISQAILSKPNIADFHSNCAQAYRALGCFKEANTHLQLALALAPNNAKITFNLACLLQNHHHYEEASKHYRQVILLDPYNGEAHFQLACTLQSLDQVNEAGKFFEKTIALQPGHAGAMNLFGLVLMEQGKLKAAQFQFEQALKIRETYIDAHINLAWALVKLGKLGKAEAHGLRALAINPEHVEANHNLGNIYYQMGRLEDAISLFRKALGINPKLSQSHCNLALALLCQGNFELGWHEFQWRIKNWHGDDYIADPRQLLTFGDDNGAIKINDNINKNSGTDGQENHGNKTILPRPSELMPIDWPHKKVLFLANQGIGDEIFFLRYLPVLQQQGALPCYQPSRKLLPLLKRMRNMPLWDKRTEPCPSADYVFSVGDLPLLAGMQSTDDIAPSLALQALQEEKQALAIRFAEFPRPWLGLTWRAGTAFIEQHIDNQVDPADEHGDAKADKNGIVQLPGKKLSKALYKEAPLDELLQVILPEIAQAKGTLFIMQRNPSNIDLSTILKASHHCRDINIVDSSAINEDLESVFALLDMLDEYIGVSNTNMHLRALLGRSAKVLLPVAPEYRWMQDVAHSPWFPDFTLFRENTAGWDQALTDLKTALGE